MLLPVHGADANNLSATLIATASCSSQPELAGMRAFRSAFRYEYELPDKCVRR